MSSGTMCTIIWAPYATTRPPWIARKVPQGLFGTYMEKLCTIFVANSLHQTFLFNKQDDWIMTPVMQYLYILYCTPWYFLEAALAGAARWFINGWAQWNRERFQPKQQWNWLLHWSGSYWISRKGHAIDRRWAATLHAFASRKDNQVQWGCSTWAEKAKPKTRACPDAREYETNDGKC